MFNLRLFPKSIHTRCSAEHSPFILLHGESHLYEKIGDLRFRISPESFFQINTEGARVLYDIVGRQLKMDQMTTLLDLCCGTGTQGYTFFIFTFQMSFIINQ